MINTLAISERLAKEGFTEAQAKALAEELFERSSDSDLVTKADLAVGLSKLKSDLVTWLLILIGMILGAYALIIGQAAVVIHFLQQAKP